MAISPGRPGLGAPWHRREKEHILNWENYEKHSIISGKKKISTDIFCNSYVLSLFREKRLFLVMHQFDFSGQYSAWYEVLILIFMNSDFLC